MAGQQKLLEQMWQLNRRRLLAEGAHVDPLLFQPEADDRYCLTLVVPLLPALTERLTPVQADLAECGRLLPLPARVPPFHHPGYL